MLCNMGLFLILLVEWLLVTETVSESYTRSYDGFVFTSTVFDSYQKKDDAQAWCKQNGSKLLEINNSYVQTLTVRFLSDTGVQFADGTLLLTNGLRNDGSWNWVNGQGIRSITVSGQEQGQAYSFGYINFNPSGFYIAAGTPIELRGFICQGKFDCSNGFLLNELCHKSYSSPTTSWFDARNRCLDEEGDLASFDFINDNQRLNSNLNGSMLNSYGTYWIGIRRQWWTWQTSNIEVKYSNWTSGRPVYLENSRCLCLTKSGVDWKWIERDCSSALPFVCLTVQPTSASTTSVSAQPNSTTNTANSPNSSGFRSTAVTYSQQHTEEPPMITAITLSSTGNNDSATRLGIGLGLGIAVGLIIAAVIIVLLVIRKQGCPRKSPPSNPPDVILHPIESHYVEIPKQPGYENNSTLDANSNQFTPPTVYADLEILTGSSSSQEKDSISLINSKTATLAPPSAHKGTTHFTVDDQEYAEVQRS